MKKYLVSERQESRGEPFSIELKSNSSLSELIKIGEMIPIEWIKFIFEIVAKRNPPKDDDDEHVWLMDESIDKIQLPQNFQE